MDTHMLKIIKTFSWAHGGIHITEYAAGSEVETDDADLIEVATREGWATEDGDDKPKRGRKPKAE
jgi:hypothetical protein